MIGWLFILKCLYFFLPAYFANMSPPLFRKLDFLEVPVDFGKKAGGIRIFGGHKTWRGILCGVIIGVIISIVQYWLYNFSFIKEISFVNYAEINIFWFGFLMALGTLLGDLLFAFFKRRQNIKPGKPWIPFDQINYVIGAFLVLTPFYEFSLAIWGCILVLSFFLHIILNYLGYLLNISRAKL